jgi:hypothetical protein
LKTWLVDTKKSQRLNTFQKPLEQPEPEPVAWLITDENINSLQVDSIQRLIDRAKHAHMTDIKLRINGQDEWYQADWLKHMTRTSPTKPESVAWRNAALRVGEDLCSVGPFGYYDMTAEQWLDWALSVVTVHAPPPKREPPCKTGSQCTTKCMECTEPEPVIDKSAAIRIATSLGWTPKREWIGLTDEEIGAVVGPLGFAQLSPVEVARAIEAKLKEKNNG